MIDVRTGAIVRTIPTGGRTPHMLGATADGGRIVTGNLRDNSLAVVSATRADSTRLIPVGRQPEGVALSHDGRFAWAGSNADGVVTDPVRAEVRVFDARTRAAKFTIAVPADSVLESAEVKGSPAPEGVAISRDSRWAFVTLQGRNRVITIDLVTGRIVAWAPSGNWSDGIGYSPALSIQKEGQHRTPGNGALNQKWGMSRS